MKLGTTALALLAVATIHEAHADSQVVRVNALNSSTTVATPFAGNQSLLVDTLVTSGIGAFSNSVEFTLASALTFNGNAAWEVNGATGFDPRLVGVNIDILDSTNTVVVSDSFLGVSSGFAVSSLTGTLGAGDYTMLITGTGQRASSIDVSLNFGGAPGNPAPPGPVDPLAALQRSSTLVDPVFAGSTLFIDSSSTGLTGPLRQALTFTAGAGVTGFTSQAAWEVAASGAVGPRLVGVTVDLYDAGNNLIFSDDFSGLVGRFALSSFAGALDPGTYTLVATGTAQSHVVLDVSLTLLGTAPVTPVPEPETYALMLAGLGAMALAGRRRKRRG